MKHFLSFAFILLLPIFLFPQSNKKNLNNEGFNVDSLQIIILKELNLFRASKGLDTLQMSEMLQSSGFLSTEKMIRSNKDKIETSQTLKHLKKAGATKRGEEITMKASIGKGKDHYKIEDVAKVIYNRWENNPKTLPILLNPKFTLVGIYCETDSENKKVYASAVFGGYDITNGGVIYKNQLAVPFNSKSKKLKNPDVKSCRTCERWRNYDQLIKGVYVEGNKIFLNYANAKDLRRVIKKSKDGIAVDVVQLSQYINADYNIVDNNLYNKGVMSKVIYRDKFFKKNLLVTKDKKANRKIKGLKVELGKFKTDINESYELNLIVVQDGKVCKTVTRGYNESGAIESNTPIGLLPTANSVGLKPAFEPRAETSLLNFTIPFEKNKSEFKQEDIQPFINALNEPDFIIDGLFIYAYSSIEGDSLTNAKLQRKRAESVVKVLQSFQKTKINPTIQTNESWDLFVLENEDGIYSDLVALGKRKAIAKINSDKKLEEDLEPILAKERFARIVMDVNYDITGPKEQKFCIIRFNQFVNAKDQTQPLKIMEFINKRVSEGRYPVDVFDSLKIQENAKNIGLINNRIYYKFLTNNTVEDEDQQTFERLLKIEPANPVLQYNKVFCQLKLDSNAGNAEHRAKVQQTIDGLYGKLDSNYVNGLNIEWQFKIMETLDTLENAEAQIDECIARIKSFYNIKDASWQNGLKLSYIFSRAKDYRYSATLLEPYLNMPNVPENLVFMYISSASRVQEKYYSRTFARALEIAKNKNQIRYCKLFGEPFMTFQVLENPEVKKVYQSSCGN